MQFKSLLIDLKSKNLVVYPTKDIAISPENSLTFFRGQTFFSSAFTVKNKNGTFLLELDTHYDRLLTSYDVMFSRHDFPFSFLEFKQYVQEAINANSSNNDENMHCIIYIIAGKSRVLDFNNDSYSNGFGGYAEKLAILMNPYKKKPDWCYENGLNLYSDIYQRPIANSKPVNYIHGALTQHVIDALNIYACLEHELANTTSIAKSLDNSFKFYHSLSISDQKAFISFLNTILYDYECLDKDKLNELFSKLSIKIKSKISWLDTFQINEIISIYKKNFPNLFHETMFVGKGTNPYILEGSTFSFMGIDKKNNCIFSPLTGNCLSQDNANTGSILNSTTIALLKRVARKYNIDYLERPFKLNEVLSFKAFYCVSTTRIKVQDNMYHLQPCKSINTALLNYSQTETYVKLMKAMYEYSMEYSYEFKQSQTDLAYSISSR